MNSIKFLVPGISCEHCVNTIQRVVGEVPGVKSVLGDVPTKHVDVQFDDPATREQIVATMTEWDYPPAE